MAVSAVDILKNAKSYPSLSKAVADSFWVIGTTRRKGQRRGNFLGFEEAVTSIKQKSKKGRVAIIFGKESKGLDNESLGMCDATVTIPSHKAYPSLNLAQAVMIVVFSIFSNSPQKNEESESEGARLCKKEEVLITLQHFKKALIALNYDKPGDRLLERILTAFHGIFKRGGMLEIESQMIKGISRRIVQCVERPGI